MINDDDLEQKIAEAWAGVELAQMIVDNALDEKTRKHWENIVEIRKQKWLKLINELDCLHGGFGKDILK